MRSRESKKFLDSLSGMSIEKLNEALVTAKKELFTLRFQNTTNQLDNTCKLYDKRKDIARIKTVITQKEKGLIQ